MPTPPSDIKQIAAIAKFESEFDNWQRLLGIISLIGLASALIAVVLISSPGKPTTAEGFAGYFLYPVYLFIAFAAILFAGGAITSEFENKTGYILFSNPVKRATLVIGKFLASFIYVFWVTTTFYLGCIISMLYLYGTVPVGIIGSFALALLYGCAVLGFVFLFGLIFRTSILAGSFSFLVIILSMPVMEAFLISVGREPWYLLTHASGSINAFGGPLISGTAAIFGTTSPQPPNPIVSTLVMAIYFIGLLGLSIYVSRRKDMI